MSMYESKSNAAFACSSKDAELNRERLNVEKTKRDLDLKVVHLESELEAQRSELTSAFEEQVRVRERDTQQRVDEAEAARLAHEMKVRQAVAQRFTVYRSTSSLRTGQTPRQRTRSSALCSRNGDVIVRGA